jgi:hypothetical protein
MAIDQGFPDLGLGKDRMPVANVPAAPDAFLKGVRFTDVTDPTPITYLVKEQRIRILGQ